MHDPNIVAFEIKKPWKRKAYNGFSYRDAIVTIWHKDPEIDGSDDSCGWSYAKLNKEERKKLDSQLDYNKSCFLEIYKIWKPEKRLEIIFTLYQTVKWILYRKHLKPKDYHYILSLCLNIHDDLNIYEDNPELEFEYLYYRLGRLVKTEYRLNCDDSAKPVGKDKNQ